VATPVEEVEKAVQEVAKLEGATTEKELQSLLL
jgi:hypothetical protein